MTLLLQQKLPRRRGITNLPPSLGTHLSAETRYGNRRLTPTFCRAATGGARQQKQEPALNCSSPMAGDWSELPRAHRTSQTPLIVSWWVGTGRSTHHAAWTASQCFLVRHKVLTEVALTGRPSGRQQGPWLRHFYGPCWCPPLAALLPAPLTLGVSRGDKNAMSKMQLDKHR